MSAPLRAVLKSRRAIVRRGLKSLLSTRPHPARARLSGVGFLPAALMRVDQHAAVCAGGGVGGRFFEHDASVFFLSDEVVTNGHELFVGVRHGSETGGVL